MRCTAANTVSGTYEYFREAALYGGDYKSDIKQMPGSQAVVKAVAVDRYGIGYSGIEFKTAGVRAIPPASLSGIARERLLDFAFSTLGLRPTVEPRNDIPYDSNRGNARLEIR